MLFTTKTPEQKRADLRAKLAGAGILQVPGAFAPQVALEIEKRGFPALYISGAVLSADLGLPDIGLTTLPEIAGRGHQIARVTDLPAIIDADTGFGEPMMVARTIQTLEAAGLAGCHIEDQVNPKRCGHLDNKELISRADMVRKLRAAADAKSDPNFLLIARTDARGVEGFDAAVDRAKAYLDAGAEMIFPEALSTLEEFARFSAAVGGPLLANMTEFGKSELFRRKSWKPLAMRW